MDEKVFEQMLLCLKPSGLIVFAATFSYLGKYFYETKLEELQNFGRLKFLKSDSFFKYDQLDMSVGKFRKTPVKVYAYQKTENDSVLGSRRQKSMKADEIKAIMSKGVMAMMQKKMVNLQVSEKISGVIKPKKIQDFRGGA